MNHFLAQRQNAKQGFLNESDSHHALRVLRLKLDDIISVSFGDGVVYTASIRSLDKKHCSFDIIEERRREEPSKLHIAIAPTKSNDRLEWFLEKAVELGIASIQLLICDHSERKVYKTDRGERIIESAFKQSHKGIMPKLKPALKIKEFLKESLPSQRLVASLNDGPKVKLKELNFKEDCLVLIGPEGDFSVSEIEQLQAEGFQHLDLGEEVLRTETAAVHVASIFNFQSQEA